LEFKAILRDWVLFLFIPTHLFCLSDSFSSEPAINGIAVKVGKVLREKLDIVLGLMCILFWKCKDITGVIPIRIAWQE